MMADAAVEDPDRPGRPGVLRREWPFLLVAAGVLAGLVVVVVFEDRGGGVRVSQPAFERFENSPRPQELARQNPLLPLI